VRNQDHRANTGDTLARGTRHHRSYNLRRAAARPATPPLRGPCTFVSTCTWNVCSQLAHHATSDCSTHLNQPEETPTANRLEILWRWEIAYMYVDSHFLPEKRTREAIDTQTHQQHRPSLLTNPSRYQHRTGESVKSLHMHVARLIGTPLSSPVLRSQKNTRAWTLGSKRKPQG
jgi:hypothetical protein